jgi:Zn-finger nucleic acid-binding protein
MIILELRQVEIDYCPFCSGIWLDAGELETLLGDSQLARDLLKSFKVEKDIDEALVKCPICRKKMHKIGVGGDHPLIIDRCRLNHGVWFDKDELQRIIKMGNVGGDSKVLDLLREMFSNKLK